MMKNNYKPKVLPPNFEFETITILKKLTEAKSALAELRGFVHVIPNQNILINTIGLQEAKDSSAVENIITTHDEIFKVELEKDLVRNLAAKEVQNYNLALQEGVKRVQKTGFINNSCVIAVQEILEKNKAGYRKIPGTSLKNDLTGKIIYEPPQSGEEIKALMFDLIDYINKDDLHTIDPLIKMSIIHFQFESIHPFYDGNGRAGRILNILYLMSKGLLDLPNLYLSRFIIQNKAAYYKHLQDVRDNGKWEEWVLFMLEGVRLTSLDTILLVAEIKKLMQEYKIFLRDNFSFYSQELLNNLFKHPYTKIDFVKDDVRVTRQTAASYLNKLSDHESGLIKKVQVGKFHYFVNVKLIDLLFQERDLMLKKP